MQRELETLQKKTLQLMTLCFMSRVEQELKRKEKERKKQNIAASESEENFEAGSSTAHCK